MRRILYRITFLAIGLAVMLIYAQKDSHSNQRKPNTETFTLFGYVGEIRHLRFSPDGKFLATLAWKERSRHDSPEVHPQQMIELMVWSLPHGQLLKKHSFSASIVVNAAISHDLSTCVILLKSGGKHDAGTLKFYEINSGELMHERSTKFNFGCLDFSRDDKILIQDTRLWDVARGQGIENLTPNLYEVAAAAFSPDGRFVALGSQRTEHIESTGAKAIPWGDVRIFNLKDHKLAYTIKDTQSKLGFVGGVKQLRYLPISEMIATIHDRHLYLWDTKTGHIKKSFHFPGPKQAHLHTRLTNRSTSLAISPNEGFIAAGFSNALATVHRIYVWNLATGELLSTFKALNTKVHALAFSPDSQYLVSGSNRIKLFRMNKPIKAKSIIKFRGAIKTPRYVGALAFSHDDKTLASVDQTVKLWDVETLKLKNKIKAPRRPKYQYDFTSVLFAPDGKTLITAGGEDGRYGEVCFWELSSLELRRHFRIHANTIIKMTLSFDGTQLITQSKNQIIKSIELSSGKVLRSWTYNEKLFNTSTHVHQLDALRQDQPIQKILPQQEIDRAYALARTPDGKITACAYENGLVKLWNRNKAFATLNGIFQLQSIRFSNDGKFLVICGDQKGKIWKIPPASINHFAQNEHLATIVGHKDSTYGIAFNHETSMFATSSWEGQIRLWEISRPDRK